MKVTKNSTLTDIKRALEAKKVLSPNQINKIASDILEKRWGRRTTYYRLEVKQKLFEILRDWYIVNWQKAVKITDKFPIGTIVKYKWWEAIYTVVSDMKIETNWTQYPISSLDAIEQVITYKWFPIWGTAYIDCVTWPIPKGTEVKILSVNPLSNLSIYVFHNGQYRRYAVNQLKKNINTNPTPKMTTSKTLQELTGGNLKKFLTAANKKKLIEADEALVEYKDIANALGQLASRLFVVLGQDQTKLQNAIDSDNVQGMKEALAQFSQTRKDMSELLGTALEELTPKQIEVKVKSIKERL